MYSLNLKNINISYGTKKVINDLSYNIYKNKITSIIGPSGCGKTTLLKGINRLLEEEKDINIKGKFFLNEADLSLVKKEIVRKKIGMVFQQPMPFPMSIYKNFKYVLNYYGIKDKKNVDKIIKDQLQIVGLYEEVKDNINHSALKLSGGQQQRLCIARNLLVNPEILLFDEPCSALDILNTQLIEKLLLRLSKKHTIIIVTHNLAQAKRISDYTMFMLDGELVESDTTEKIFNNPKNQKTKEYIQGLFG